MIKITAQVQAESIVNTFSDFRLTVKGGKHKHGSSSPWIATVSTEGFKVWSNETEWKKLQIAPAASGETPTKAIQGLWDDLTKNCKCIQQPADGSVYLYEPKMRRWKPIGSDHKDYPKSAMEQYKDIPWPPPGWVMASQNTQEHAANSSHWNIESQTGDYVKVNGTHIRMPAFKKLVYEATDYFDVGIEPPDDLVTQLKQLGAADIYHENHPEYKPVRPKLGDYVLTHDKNATGNISPMITGEMAKVVMVKPEKCKIEFVNKAKKSKYGQQYIYHTCLEVIDGYQPSETETDPNTFVKKAMEDWANS